ncbi:MAG: hypothetical protein JNK31_08490 [Candidatus Competibacter sp.]|nr:hypothetical protein [Candidatus Competibacter sp.]
MTIWQLSGWLVLVGVAALIAAAGWLLSRFVQAQKQVAEQRTLLLKQAAAARAAAESDAAAARAAESAVAARTAAERLAAKRAAAEQAAAERAIQEKSALEQAIAEWAAAEQAESERVQRHQAHAEHHESEQMEARMQAVEDAIAEWLVAEQAGHHLLNAVASPGGEAKKGYTRTEAIHQQIRLTAERVDKEAQDLDFIKNRIETGVDFLPLEFKQTIEEWKKGQMLRHSTFDDLKLKFRYKAYSIEDGYELLYRYGDWLDQQRRKLRVFIRLLGTVVDDKESIPAAIERAEQNEREKYLEMNVDALFALNDVRGVLGKLIGMEAILKELEIVCRKRSEQIIAPSWEAKGSL